MRGGGGGDIYGVALFISAYHTEEGHFCPHADTLFPAQSVYQHTNSYQLNQNIVLHYSYHPYYIEVLSDQSRDSL